MKERKENILKNVIILAQKSCSLSLLIFKANKKTQKIFSSKKSLFPAPPPPKETALPTNNTPIKILIFFSELKRSGAQCSSQSIWN
jgi:hypothetical protein